MEPKLPRSKDFVIAVLVATFSFSLALWLYLQYPLMYGIDGPYYIVQVRHVAEDGFPKYPDPPLTFYMLAPFYALFADKILGLKVGVSLFIALTAMLLYFAFSRASRNEATGLLASLLFAISPFTP